jgi:hypothetical protein
LDGIAQSAIAGRFLQRLRRRVGRASGRVGLFLLFDQRGDRSRCHPCAEFGHQVNMYTIHGLYVSQTTRSPMSRDLCIGGDGQLRDNPNTLSLSDSMGG